VLAISDFPHGLKNIHLFCCDNLNIQEFPLSVEIIGIQGRTGSFPALPAGLLELSTNNYIFNELPEGLLKMDISYCEKLSMIPKLPNTLQELRLCSLSSATNFMSSLPENLKSLEINLCENLKIPNHLPENLSEIKIAFAQNKEWDISAKDLPRGVNINTHNLILSSECYDRKDITFYNIYTESSRNFNSGDVVYGTAHGRAPVSSMIKDINNLSDKDIIIQNTLTNAVWDRNYFWTYNSDEHIKNKLNDADRGREFKAFLENHERYDVTDEKFRNLSDIQRWTKTSKAGLEFQTKIREKQVIFCIDLLIDSIPDIASKGGVHGDAITAHELRWIYRNRDDEKVKENVKFSLKGNIISHDAVFSLKGWEKYQPKRMKTANMDS
jgi:hypothetical protein